MPKRLSLAERSRLLQKFAILARMKTRKGKTLASGPNGTGRKRSTDRQLVLLDQGKLRRKAASECSREMARLEKAKTEWKRFQTEDKAPFERWMAATFGALLSRLRETEARLHEKEALVHEVDMEMVFGGARSHRSAYARIDRRRTNPPPKVDPKAGPPPSQDDGTGFEHVGFDDLPEFEQELLFEDFLRVVMGMNPDRMGEMRYQKMFADFKADMRGPARPESPPAPESPKPEQSRIKELYRLLVRRLHPDTRAESDAEVSALWHEVQEAYSEGNVERLEMLLALTDLQSNTTGEHTSLFQMRSVLAELRRSFNALQRNLRAAKQDPAWNFARLKEHSLLQKRMRGDLESNLFWHEGRLQQIEALIASWSAPRKRRKMHATRQQVDFQF